MTEPLFDPAAPELIRESYSDEDPPPPPEWAEEIPPPEVSPLDEPVGDTGFTMADVIEETREVQQRQRSALSIPSMIEADPEKAKKQVDAWTEILPTLQRASIKATRPSDWIVMKAKDAPNEEASCFPRKGACLQLRRFFGISILKPRNIHTGKPECHVTEYDGEVMRWDDWARRKVPVPVRARRAEIWVDAVSERLGESIEAVRGVRSSTEDFVGRASEKQDLEESARTSAESKAVRILSGIVSLPAQDIADIMGLDLEVFIGRATKGSGFGSSAERKTEKQGQGGGSSHASDFFKHVVGLFNGDEAKAWEYLRKMASFVGKNDGKMVVPNSYDEIAGKAQRFHILLEKFNAAHPDHAFKAE